MTNRDDLEKNKFILGIGGVNLRAVGGASPATALLTGHIDTLEIKKFTPSGSVRTITTF